MKISINKLSRLLQGNFNCIEIAYLFGSSTQGDVKDGSDIDLALFVENDYLNNNPEIGLNIEIFIQEKLNVPTDVVILNKANSVLRYQALSQGVRLFEKDSEKRAITELCFVKDYFDLAYYQNRRRSINGK